MHSSLFCLVYYCPVTDWSGCAYESVISAQMRPCALGDLRLRVWNLQKSECPEYLIVSLPKDKNEPEHPELECFKINSTWLILAGAIVGAVAGRGIT
jgi:hypothetical protein